ncbi:hypothetical protein A1359_07350 [Methylomonas lenta]|uniref:Type I restriction modification DNA specificity domain-containing protein n=1 Tax=Methylomonas lenta TaxID=980561 RepID=A0A177NHB8_9GAMM|nr:restriction endonuclease subunit S [Methylomonas lenta]OAI16460.1 hypothetical protein A1359_07350 [Methylomonas lenta]
MKYQAYPEYKDSGVEWLNQAPAHWTSVPIKYMALDENSLFLDGDWIESKDISGDDIRYITTGNVGIGDYKEQGGGYITEEKFKELNCTEVFENDILVSRLNLPIGRACIVPNLNSRIVTSVDNVIFRPDSKFFRKYVVHLFSCKEYFKHTEDLARGATMQRISRGLLGNIRVITPPYDEQLKISSFLDYETAKIDTLIEKQQQLIQLLKEKRQAVISHAVTKGLNPDVPMRDSGVEWLGEVPEHWEIIRLKYLLVDQVKNGLFKKKDEFGSGSLLVNVSDLYVEYNFIKLESLDRVITSAEERKLYKVESGDIFFVRSSLKLEGIGRSACFLEDHENVVFECHIVNAKPNKQMMSPKFLIRYLNSLSVSQEFVSRSRTTTMTTIDQSNLATINVVVPSVAEQVEIDDFLDRQLRVFENSEQLAQDSISLLQERRTALISAAVTGKIDVRNWQPPKTNTSEAA